jgi:hypothetical protein
MIGICELPTEGNEVMFNISNEFQRVDVRNNLRLKDTDRQRSFASARIVCCRFEIVHDRCGSEPRKGAVGAR